jgi:hypothetical protein
MQIIPQGIPSTVVTQWSATRIPAVSHSGGPRLTARPGLRLCWLGVLPQFPTKICRMLYLLSFTSTWFCIMWGVSWRFSHADEKCLSIFLCSFWKWGHSTAGSFYLHQKFFILKHWRGIGVDLLVRFPCEMTALDRAICWMHNADNYVVIALHGPQKPKRFLDHLRSQL